MKKTNLQKKLATYSALSGAFLLAGDHEVEAQIVYVDPPDVQYCATASVPVPGGTNSSVIDTVYVNVDVLATANAAINTDTYLTANAKVAFNPIAFGRYLSTSYNRTTYGYYTSYYYTTYVTVARQGIGGVFGTGQLINNDSTYFSTFFSTTKTYYGPVANIPSGQMIGPGDQFAAATTSFRTVALVSAVDAMITTYYTGTPVNSNDIDTTYISGSSGFITSNPSSTTGMVGFRFDNAGNTHYGWMRIQVDVSGNSLEDGQQGNITGDACVTVLDFAYNATPDEPIRAGQTELAPIPTMGQWGIIVLNFLLLIFGVVAVKEKGGLFLKRREAINE